MKEPSDKIIDNYIERITTFSQNFQGIPTSEELDKIVSELGITDEQISVIQIESQAYFIRAKSYMKLKQWDDAIVELQEAISLNPFSLEMICCLCEAYMGRWQLKHRREDAINIQSTARKCFQIQPDCEVTMNLLCRFNRLRKWRKNSKIFTSIIISIPICIVPTIFIYYKPLQSIVLSNPFIASLISQNAGSKILAKHLQESMEDIKIQQSALREEVNSLKNKQLINNRSNNSPPPNYSPPVNSPTPVAVDRPPTDRFISDYYSKIKSGQTVSSWGDFTSDYQNNSRANPGGYSGDYLKWWGGLGRNTEVGRIETIDANADRAIVQAHCRFRRKSYIVRYYLIFDESSQSWKINRIDKI